MAWKLAALVGSCTLIAACGPAPTPPASSARIHGGAAAAPRALPAAAPPAHLDLAPFLAPVESAPGPKLDLLPGTLALGLAEATPSVETNCNEQAPQDFLIRSSYVWQPLATPEDRAARKVIHRRAVEYRSRHYGFVEGSGDPKWNHLPPHAYVRDGRFFGVPVRMNNRVLTALGCVEKVIAHDCESTPYAPHILDGLRTRNTFHNDEVSNHLYGIAIDIDPDKNSCCGCVPPLSEWPRCKKPVASPFERSFVPKCWVDRFERFGFYWLGYDQLEDTMHFEFLGDPTRIVKKRG